MWGVLLHGSLPTFRHHPWASERPLSPLVLGVAALTHSSLQKQIPSLLPGSPQLSHACVVCSSGFTIFLTILICPSEDHARAIDPVL